MPDKKLFHAVGVEGVHPHNTWERRPDGLYGLSGLVYAFTDDQVKRCTRAGWTFTCECWTRPDGTHTCPREGCTG